MDVTRDDFRAAVRRPGLFRRLVDVVPAVFPSDSAESNAGR